jgi:hypothetical protein
MEQRIPLDRHTRLYEALLFLPESVRNAPGDFLNSDLSTLRKGDFYLLGYNPGGEPGDYSIEGAIHQCTTGEIHNWPAENWNAYLDEEWGSEKGEHLIQRNVQTLCKSIGVDLRQICASNLIFIQSRNEGALKEKNPEIFLPVHEAVLDIVRPRCILVFGLKTYYIVKSLLGLDEKRVFRGANGKVISFRVANGQYRNQPMKLVGFRHFRYYSLESHADVRAEIEKECAA